MENLYREIQVDISFKPEEIEKLADFTMNKLYSSLPEIDWTHPTSFKGVQGKLVEGIVYTLKLSKTGFGKLINKRIIDVTYEEALAINQCITQAESESNQEAPEGLEKFSNEINLYWVFNPPRPFASWRKDLNGRWIKPTIKIENALSSD